MEITHEKRGRGKPKLYGEKTKSLSFAVPISHYDRLKEIMEEELELLKTAKTTTEYYCCGKCKNGTVILAKTISQFSTEIEISKCNNCNYVYDDIKEVEHSLSKYPF
jgi:hypothetical protein